MKKLKMLIAIVSVSLLTAGCSGGSSNNSVLDFSEKQNLHSEISTDPTVSEISESSEKSSVPESSPTESDISAENSGEPEQPSQEQSEPKPTEQESSEQEQSSEKQSEPELSEPVSSEPSAEESSKPEESSSPAELSGEIYKTEYKYFYHRLTELEKKDFKVLYLSALNFLKQAEFAQPISSDELERLMWLLNYDCPELIHVTGDYLPQYNNSNEIISVNLYYNMESSEYEERFRAVEAYMTELKQFTAEMNDLQKERYVFEKLFSETVFDEYNTMAGSVYGALIEHESRCEGISKSFAWCMNELGVECFTVAGRPLWENDNLYASHSWNIIKLDGEYYHVDLAADNMKTSADEFALPLYSFFNAYDSVILKTRTIYDAFLDLGVPDCTSDKLNYHVMNGCLISADDDPMTKFKDILSRCYFDDRENAISIRFEDINTYDDFFSEREEWLHDFLTENNYQCTETFYCNDVGQTMILYTVPG